MRHPFDLLMELPDEHIRLDCAALHLARDIYPAVDIRHYLETLDELADQVAALRPGLQATLRYQALREVLVDQWGFAGNTEDYYDPDNSYLHRVLDRGVGIPISLSIVWIEVARRLKWPVFGVSFPGHFLVRFEATDHFVIADPFRDGRSLSAADCRRLLRERGEGRPRFHESLLEPASTRCILVRMLQNLRAVYAAQQDGQRLEPVLQRLLAADPADACAAQELASLYARRGDLGAARRQLAVFLAGRPAGTGAKAVRRSMKCLDQAFVALN